MFSLRNKKNIFWVHTRKFVTKVLPLISKLVGDGGSGAVSAWYTNLTHLDT